MEQDKKMHQSKSIFTTSKLLYTHSHLLSPIWLFLCWFIWVNHVFSYWQKCLVSVILLQPPCISSTIYIFQATPLTPNHSLLILSIFCQQIKKCSWLVSTNSTTRFVLACLWVTFVDCIYCVLETDSTFFLGVHSEQLNTTFFCCFPQTHVITEVWQW